ncbi:MAG: acetate--CoA ligase family protein [Bacteroidetes bacterium]|nr:acetate--CoA ligase family protein [Bacteroidota bacterium]
MNNVNKVKIRNIIDNATNGYLQADKVQELLDAALIPRAKELVVCDKKDVINATKEIGFPLVMKVVGPVHKSDVGGVKLNINDENTALEFFEEMLKIKDVTGVLFQPMLSGMELFIGAKREDKFGHLILCGLGGIFIEVLKDVQYALIPVTKQEAFDMLKSLKAYKIIEGFRGNEGINQDKFTDIIVQLSALLEAAPEIFEMDINPLLAKSDIIIAVDARIRVEK